MTGIFTREIFRFIWHRKEALIWLSALIFLAFGDPHQHHYTLCPLSNMGFEYCPGCGIGRAITLFFNGGFKASFLSHPLGMPAIAVIIARIYVIIRGNTASDFHLNQINQP